MLPGGGEYQANSFPERPVAFLLAALSLDSPTWSGN